ncbi:MAG: cadherin-like beta sandwich domain-containing protein [Clostridia bacterium]|nr:cadherin-like beta sandwich domain-containing protein [Clostridia bacterium]
MYQIKVTKTDNIASANTNLEILAIENYLLNPPFDNSVTQYKLEISKDTTNLNVFAVPESEQGKVNISGNENLKEGNNNIIITVTAPNGITKRDYKITAYKRNISEEENYNKEQEEQKENLEEAYEMEKTSANSEEPPIIMANENNKYIIVVATISIIAVIIIGILLYKKYIRKR